MKVLEENIEKNNVKCVCEAKYLKWGEILKDLTIFDLIVGSDLLYSEDIVVPLFTTVSQLLGRHSKFLLVSSFDIGQVSAI